MTKNVIISFLLRPMNRKDLILVGSIASILGFILAISAIIIGATTGCDMESHRNNRNIVNNVEIGAVYIRGYQQPPVLFDAEKFREDLK